MCRITLFYAVIGTMEMYIYISCMFLIIIGSVKLWQHVNHFEVLPFDSMCSDIHCPIRLSCNSVLNTTDDQCHADNTHHSNNVHIQVNQNKISA